SFIVSANSSMDRSHHFEASILLIVSGGKRYLISRAGFPSTMPYGGRFLFTTLPAPITAPSPIEFTDGRMVTLWPMNTSFPITRLVRVIRSCRILPKQELKKNGCVESMFIG